MKGFALSLAIIFGVIWIIATFNGCQSSASAHPFFGHHGSWGAKKHDFIKYMVSEELDLTEDQKAELDRITADLRDQHDTMRPSSQAFRDSLLRELAKDQVAAEDLKQLFQGHKPALEAKVALIAEKLAEFHAMLTPDQRAVLTAHMESHSGDEGCAFGSRFSSSGKAAWVKEKRLDMVKYMISAELDLTEDQKAGLDRIVGELQNRHEAVRASFLTIKTGLMSELGKDQVFAEDFMQLFEAQKPVLEGMADLMAEKAAEFHALLTPEQREILLTRLESHGRGCRFGRRW